MKLKYFITEKKTEGLYAAVNFSKDTIERILSYCKKAKIPNVLKPDEFHSTLAYSRVPVKKFVPIKVLNEIGIPKGFEVWPSEPNAFKDKKTYCLVLKFDSDYMQQRFKELMDMGATYDFEKYNPHITLSYDVGEGFDIKKLPSLREFGRLLYITGEYTEPLELNE